MATNPEQFERLLREFASCQPRPRAGAEFLDLLKLYETAATAGRVSHHADSLEKAAEYTCLLEQFDQQIQILDAQKAESADSFNMLKVFGLTHWELSHSRALAWLLDRNPRRFGTHYQGSLGFRLFLQALGMDVSLADEQYRVSTEVVGAEARIDLEISCPGKFLICIENKIWAAEGCDQTEREWRDMQRRADELGIDDQTGIVRAFFLTPDGDAAACPHFKTVGWRLVMKIMERFADEAKAPKVKQFARHYADILRENIVEGEENE